MTDRPFGEVIPPDFDEQSCKMRLAFIGFTERDAQLLHDLEDMVKVRLDEITERFYLHLLSFEETRKVFKDEAMIQRLAAAQKIYLTQLLQGPYDTAYFEHRWRIGYMHNAIKVEPHWFIGAFHYYHHIISLIILEHYRNDVDAVLEHIQALEKIMNLDMQLGIQSYYIHYGSTMSKLRELNSKIASASSAKSQFLANMSHEFRTPLNAIIGFTEVLQDQIPGPLNADQLEYLGDIHDGGQLLLRLINDVLDLSKVEAGRLELFYETFPVAQTIRETIASMRGLAKKKGLSIEINLPPDLGLITADKIRFKQVLYNLLSNAVKFTDKGGVTVSAKIAQDCLNLTVADTGIGIRAEDLERIFVEFSQVDSSHTRRYEGTGLGLALSRRLIEAHGGKIWIESAIGVGSTLHVELPLQPANKSIDADASLR